jgi:hypothetical protein
MPFLNQASTFADRPFPTGTTQNFQYCVKIVNLDRYPNYLVFAQINASTASPSNHIQMQIGRCLLVDGYRSSVTIKAIVKNRVKTSDLQKTKVGIVLKNPQLQKALIVGTPSIGRPVSMPMINDGRKIEASFEIQSIDSQGLTLIRVPQAKPALNVLLFPALGIAILGWLAWQPRSKTVG